MDQYIFSLIFLSCAMLLARQGKHVVLIKFSVSRLLVLRQNGLDDHLVEIRMSLDGMRTAVFDVQ